MPKTNSESSVDWSKCFLCKLQTSEKLQNPSPDGYKTIVDNLLQFRDLNELPVDIDISLLDNGSGIEESVLSNDAKCH